MVCCKLTVILLTVLVWLMLLSSPYRTVAYRIGLVYIVYLLLRVFVLKTRQWWAIPQTKEQLREKIQPGDVIHTSGVVNASMMDGFNVVRLIFDENEIHTQYAISHNNQLYILNTYITDYFNDRKKSFMNPESVIIIESNERYTGAMEPIDEFLHVESLDKSYVRVVKTRNKTLVFDPTHREVFQQLMNAKFAHCSQALGKYLETQQLVKNQSAYSDIFYYTPDVVRKSLGVISNTLYQLK